MNKLVIIGNGFDLAHGLKTRYSDFILWYLNKRIKVSISSENDLVVFSGVDSSNRQLKSMAEFNDRLKANDFEIRYRFDFFETLIDKFQNSNWVDIEKLYYDSLVKIYKQYEKSESYDSKELINLNNTLQLIGLELEDYLKNQITPLFIENQDIKRLFDSEVLNESDSDVYVLNFNYTSVVEAYLPLLERTNNELTLKFGEFGFENSEKQECQSRSVYLNNIHGELGLSKPIIFGYGDETDEYYEKIENLKDNEFLKYMKSFAYLQTQNYQNLFSFLDNEYLPLKLDKNTEEGKDNKMEKVKFDVYIMGHSCGVSDRLLFTHIFEHPLMNSVKLYYYEKPDGTNDFYEKTQELSRHFRKDTKHKMRKCIIPFNFSKPLPQIKKQN